MFAVIFLFSCEGLVLRSWDHTLIWYFPQDTIVKSVLCLEASVSGTLKKESLTSKPDRYVLPEILLKISFIWWKKYMFLWFCSTISKPASSLYFVLSRFLKRKIGLFHSMTFRMQSRSISFLIWFLKWSGKENCLTFTGCSSPALVCWVTSLVIPKHCGFQQKISGNF